MEAYREEPAYEQRECDDEKRYWRICVECETQIRAAELANWSEVEKKNNPHYAEKWKVRQDLKVANKGKAHAAT
eukprot:5789277-Lingulodinium_polyedra.AAC.1